MTDTTAAEPTFEPAPTTNLRVVRRAHAASTRAQLKERWTEAPKWFRRGVGIPAGLLGVYLVWTFGIAPTLRAAAAVEARGQVADAYESEMGGMTQVLGQYVDQRVGELRGQLPPVVVIDAPLGWLPCPVSMNARGLIGAAAGSNGTKLDPVRAGKVNDDARGLLGRGVPLTQIRVTLDATGNVMASSNAGDPLLMDACPASGAVVPAPAAAAPAPAPAAAPAGAPITPPAGAN